MESIGVRELRQHASRWLARVQAGESFEVTDRGRPVASLTPVAASAWDRLVANGAVTRARSKLADITPIGTSDGPSLTMLLAEDRDDER